MSKLWIVVADQSKARIFTISDTNSALLEVGELVHPEARMHEQDLKTDRSGRSFNSLGKGSHAMGSAVEPARQEAIQFAKQIADHIHSAHDKGICNRLMLVSGSPLLGLLREKLKSISGIEIIEIDKNLGQYDAMEIRKHLPKHL